MLESLIALTVICTLVGTYHFCMALYYFDKAYRHRTKAAKARFSRKVLEEKE